jgi:hypothetical protein
MHIVPRYVHVSDIAMCAHYKFITLGAACCDQDLMLPSSMRLRTGGRAVCVMCGLVARAPTPLHGIYQTVTLSVGQRLRS